VAHLFALPFLVRVSAVFVLGVIAATQINRGIYRLAWNRRAIGPWSPPPEQAPPRSVCDRLPIAGWVRLRREEPLHGRGYWLRPLLIELLFGLGMALLYWWEMAGGLLPLKMPFGRPPMLDPGTAHAIFAGHFVLCCLMMVATFIDIDEQTIPDEITVSGTLLGLLFAAFLPMSLLPDPVPASEGGAKAVPLLLTAPQFGPMPVWPVWLDESPGLLVALGCFLGWCIAITAKTITLRKGWGKCLAFLCASILRSRSNRLVALIAVLGIAGIAGVWWTGGASWRAILSQLVGVAFGGMLIWLVRVVGSWALGREAMGYGDVTLMCMIGAFVGWQSTLIVFFLAPFAGIFIALAQWLLRGERHIAFGPFLCGATLLLIVAWAEIWKTWGRPVFGLEIPGLFPQGWVVVIMVIVCLVLLGTLLGIWRLIADRLLRDDAQQ